jgi:serine/threonine-protein kinase
VSLVLSDPKVGTTVAGRYRLEERLGAGGMGVVYRGVDVEDGREVAVKFLHEALAGIPDLVKRFDREVAALKRVQHPGLTTIVDAGVVGGVPFLVMELHRGKPLSDLLERGALSPGRAVQITKRVLAAVEAAHESGVVHRDLKPDNILLDGEGVKILDFGLAKMVAGSESGATQLTNTGLAIGTPGYMAPEQARGTATDHRADLYSVGVILYHMVAGKKPFVADSAMAVMRMHMDDPPPPPRKAAPDAKLSVAIERVILRALEKEPAKRWPSADAFSRALDATPEGGGKEVSLAFDETRVAKGAGRSSRRRLFKLVSRVGLVALLCIAGWMGVTRVTRWYRRDAKHAVDSAVDKAKDALRTVTKPIQAAAKQVESAAKQVPLPSTEPVDDDADPTEPPSRDTPGAKLEASTDTAHPAAPGKKAPRLADAIHMIQTGKVDEGVQLLYLLRRTAPKSPAIALWLGHAYFKKLWRTDGLREYDDALEWMPSLRHDGPLVRDAVGALDDPTYRMARALIRKRIGAAALPELRRAARDAKKDLVAARATRLGIELSKQARRRH